MALFSRRGRKAPPPPVTEEPGDHLLGSPAFGQLIETLEKDPDRKYQILDLAPASGNHVAFFSRFRCRFHVGDLEDSLDQWSSDDEEEPPPDPSLLLPLEKGTAFDLVLLWDLLNYLDEEGIARLGEHLRGYCAKDAWLHAFIHTRATMPAQPVRFDLLEPGQMRWHPVDETITAPRYAQRVLERLLPGFGDWKSRLLQNGLQEYLFRAR